MTQQTLFELAQNGDLPAFITLLNQKLEPKKILITKYLLEDYCLSLKVKADQLPSPQDLANLINQWVSILGNELIGKIRIYAKQIKSTIKYEQEFLLSYSRQIQALIEESLIPFELCCHYKIIPLAKLEKQEQLSLLVGIVTPNDLDLHDDLYQIESSNNLQILKMQISFDDYQTLISQYFAQSNQHLHLREMALSQPLFDYEDQEIANSPQLQWINVSAHPPSLKRWLDGQSPLPQLIEQYLLFAFNLYRRLNSGNENFLFSPYSIFCALLMAYVGARTHTAVEMANALYLLSRDQQTNLAWFKMNQFLIGDRSTVKIVNRLWGDKNYHFLEDFLNLLENDYQGNLERVDFQNGDQTTKIINHWIDQETKGKIPQLIEPNSLNPSTRLLFTNVIYFKERWLEPFDPALTQDQPFYVKPDQPVNVPMMMSQHYSHANYAEFEQFQLLELPYINQEQSMVILLPKKDYGLAQIEIELDPEQLKQRLSACRQTIIDQLWLPKFKISCFQKLKRPLMRMGMIKVFLPEQADFSGMTAQENLYIDDVIHQAVINVDEEGTEAAAATAVKMIAVCNHPYTCFRADRPFIYLIRDIPSGIILFLGTMLDPSKS